MLYDVCAAILYAIHTSKLQRVIDISGDKKTVRKESIEPIKNVFT